MHYRFYDDLFDAAVPGIRYMSDGSPVLGRNVVPVTDGTVYTIYEVRSKQCVVLTSPNIDDTGQGTNHLYYVISGTGSVCMSGKEDTVQR